jgi:P27 family predicted phage terminase small subunit
MLAGDALTEWTRLAPQLWALGCLTTLDVHLLAAHCCAYARWRQAVGMLVELERRDPQTKGLVVRTPAGDSAPTRL